MTVHELYESKKKEYTKYQVDMGVYESRLNEALSNIAKSANELDKELEEFEQTPLTDNLNEVIALITNTISVDELNTVRGKLEKISAEVEYEIRRVLE